MIPLVSVDLRAFSDRAAAWTEAHQQHRDDARTRALSLAAQARAEQESQAAAATTPAQAPATTAPPTTAPPTTAPPTTGVPESTAPATTGSTEGETETGSETTATVAPSTSAAATVAPSTSAAATVAPSTSAAATVAPSTSAAATVPTEEQWEALRQCESSGNYRAISIRPAGRYRGAYQFSRSTWDWVAPQIGADHLVGVDPAEASPADQDRMAQALWDINGWAPWPACSRRLGYL